MGTPETTQAEILPVDRALAVTRIIAMRAHLEFSLKSGGWAWTCLVRASNGSVFRRRGAVIANVVDEVHRDWAPAYAEQKRAAADRAAKFNVTTPDTSSFEGIVEVPEDKQKVFAHFYDRLVLLEDERPTLRFMKERSEWELVLQRLGTVQGQTLKALCNRLDSNIHEHFSKEEGSLIAELEETETGSVEAAKKRWIMPALLGLSFGFVAGFFVRMWIG